MFSLADESFLGQEGGGGSTLRKYGEDLSLIWSRDTEVNGQTHTPRRILTLAGGHVVLGHFYGFDLYSADGYLATSLSVDGYGSDVAIDALLVDAFDHDLEPLWTRTLALDPGSQPQTVIDPLGYTWVAGLFRPDGASESRPMVLALHP